MASILLNLVMFGLSLIAALGTAFLAGPTLAGETESGIALSVLARPIRRSAFLLGKWLGLVIFGSGFVVVAGLTQCLVVWVTAGYWPPRPAAALLLLAEPQAERASRVVSTPATRLAERPRMRTGVVLVSRIIRAALPYPETGRAWQPGPAARPGSPAGCRRRGRRRPAGC